MKLGENILKNKEIIIKFWIYTSVILVVFIICNILGFIFFNGIKEINLNFLIKNPEGLPLGSSGGVKNAIIGSLFLMVISMILSIILGVNCAIFNIIYCKNKGINAIINLIVQCIASIPSIIIGLFVYGFFIVTLNVPRSMFTAGISLSIMVFPFVEKRVEKIILSIDRRILRDSEVLGIDKDYMCKNLILPIIKKEIISTGILAGSYAIGATAPIILTGAVFVGGNSNKLFSPVMALPFHLHMLLGQSTMYEKSYATALVLIFILIFLHILSEIVMLGIGGKIIEYIRIKKN